MKTFALVTAAAVLALSAGAASAQDRSITIGDLDLSTPQGAAQFDRRVDRAARSLCSGRSPLEVMACIKRFREAAHETLPAARREEYARGRTNRELAMVPAFYG